MKYIIILLIAFVACLKSEAQETGSLKRSEQLRQLLGMSKGQYTAYSEGLNEYDRNILSVLQNQALEKSAKGAALSKAVSERRAYVEKHLSQEQRNKLHQFNKEYEGQSSRIKQKKQAEERLKAKGITVKSDSTSRG